MVSTMLLSEMRTRSNMLVQLYKHAELIKSWIKSNKWLHDLPLLSRRLTTSCYAGKQAWFELHITSRLSIHAHGATLTWNTSGQPPRNQSCAYWELDRPTSIRLWRCMMVNLTIRLTSFYPNANSSADQDHLTGILTKNVMALNVCAISVYVHMPPPVAESQNTGQLC